MLYKKITSLCVIAGALALSACVTPSPKLTPLQIEAMQTSSFEADRDTVYASVLSVFQTLGYTIRESDKDAGLIVAEGLSEDSSNKALGFLAILSASLGGGYQQVEKKSAKVIANAFVEKINEKDTRVRINLVREEKSSNGTTNSRRVLNGKFYQNAFAQIGDAVFLRQSNK